MDAQLMAEIANDALTTKVEEFKKSDVMLGISTRIQSEANKGLFEISFKNEEFGGSDTKRLAVSALKEGGYLVVEGVLWVTVSWYTSYREDGEEG